ncbi:penicillin-insensitive murein endopeptidase [Microcoleus sp. OTE_8_concoct_300]|uniref:penicillin-insensitive murein endopeptidase n=1 Tax=Microcoleus sp. OTE_8_concoct_300 TaxID=2964710 RepID=UPI00403F636D
MSIESVLNNQELTEELLDSDYFENSQRLPKTHIDPATAKNYLQTSIKEGLAKAQEGLGRLRAIQIEAIINYAERPALKIQNGDFETPRLAYWKTRLEPHRSIIRQAIASVGRIELKNHERAINFAGTGWLVTDDVIVTNRHIAQLFAFQEGGKFVFRRNDGTQKLIKVKIDFLEEYLEDNEEEFNIDRVLYIEPDSGSDIAFLKVTRVGDTKSRSFIPLATKVDTRNSDIAVIGYPAWDGNRNPLEPAKMFELFGDIYNVKRLQPGKVMSATGSRDRGPNFTHDCSTLGGNSGSIVLDFETGKAVGLHYGGEFERENYAIPVTIIEQRLNDLLSGKLKISSISETPVIIFSSPIDLETVDNETPIEFEDTPCLYHWDDESLESFSLEATPFPAVNTQLPISGTGYYSYSQFREKQFGLPETIKAIEEIGKMWFQNHRTGPVIGIGNISKNGGGPVPPHQSHQTGLDVDFRLLRTDGARIGITFRDPNYSLARTQDLINTILNNSVQSVKLILCNDNNLKGVKPWPGHDDHLHVRFSK